MRCIPFGPDERRTTFAKHMGEKVRWFGVIKEKKSKAP
jgi:hypothetical protein